MKRFTINTSVTVNSDKVRFILFLVLHVPRAAYGTIERRETAN